jgi:hypothetical protein
MATQFGKSQIGKPPPLWYRRLTTAMIMYFVPGMVGTVQAIPMNADTRNLWMCAASAIPFLVKGVGALLGNGEVYAKPEENEK